MRMDNDNKNAPARHGGASNWENRALEICEQEIGADKFQRRYNKRYKIPPAGFGSKTRLSLEEGKAKKAVTGDAAFLRHYNAAGAVGYAHVLNDPRIPRNDFFIPGRRFKVRLRHSNLRSDDDASLCQREAAIKFADQNEDGPLDLVLLTGRTAMANNGRTVLDLLRLRRPDDYRSLCYKDPHFYWALVDCLRRAPASFADLHYHSQVAYRFLPADRRPRLLRFRCIPHDDDQAETGLPDDQDQKCPWQFERRGDETRAPSYLRREFLDRLKQAPVRYVLQVQLRRLVGDPAKDDIYWNPQIVWDERECPWIDLAELKFTTPMTTNAIKRTYYNITDKPTCLKFPQPSSVHCYRSYHRIMCIMYTTMEIKGIGHPQYSATDMDTIRKGYKDKRVNWVVSVCSGLTAENRPQVEVYIALTGTHGRSSGKRLDDRLDLQVDDPCVEFYNIHTEPVGELLTVTVSVRHRHLTDEWYLRYVTVSPDEARTHEQLFPCHSVVLSKITLRPGEVSLPHAAIHEVLRQERLLEMRDRQIDYAWHAVLDMPSQIRGKKIRDIPINEQVKAEKYSTISWDIDTALADILRPILLSLNPQQPFSLSRQISRDDATKAMEMHRRRRMTTCPEQALAQKNARRRYTECGAVINNLDDVFISYAADKGFELDNRNEQERWIKIKHAIHFLSRVKLPDGTQGEMCRQVQEDLDFARSFLMGSNPCVIRRCEEIPEHFPVMEQYDQIKHYMDRGQELPEECKAGHVYLADYKILDGVPCIHRDADNRFVVAPLVLLYVKASGETIPLAIQLHQEPGPHNPVWMPRDKGEDWLLAKLWVRSADFHHQLVISHIVKCHLIMEPFAIATSRQLSTSHPIYKLLQPHCRFTITTNTLLRQHVMRKGGSMDKFTSIGSEGFRKLARRFYGKFSFEDLDLPKELASRGVADATLLPQYYYRDDALRLWAAISKYCFSIITIFYKTNDDVVMDGELQSWIKDINHHGFRSTQPVSQGPSGEHINSVGLPITLTSICELVDLCTKLIFHLTCQHAATHTEAMDLYGHMPLVPAMMRAPPPSKKRVTTKDLIQKTLPTEQSAEAYYGSLAFVMQLCKVDNNPLGNSADTYFVEKEAQAVKEDFTNTLQQITDTIQARNLAMDPIKYEALLPEKIPNCAEIMPFVPIENVSADCLDETGKPKPGVKGINLGNPSVPLMTLPICMQFARNMGGRSFLGRQMSVNAFSNAMKGVGMDKVSVPMGAIDRGMNMRNMNMMNIMY